MRQDGRGLLVVVAEMPSDFLHSVHARAPKIGSPKIARQGIARTSSQSLHDCVRLRSSSNVFVRFSCVRLHKFARLRTSSYVFVRLRTSWYHFVRFSCIRLRTLSHVFVRLRTSSYAFVRFSCVRLRTSSYGKRSHVRAHERILCDIAC